MIPVLVETNWVVDVCAPPFRREPTALSLLDRAAAAELEIHIPAVSLREASDVVRRKYQPTQAKVLREYRSWAVRCGHVSEAEAQVAKVFLDRFEGHTRAALARSDDHFEEVATAPNVHVFALTDEMLELAIDLRTKVENLSPFDEAILAAVLVRGSQLRDRDPIFCTLDSDLSPRNRRGQPRPEFVELYADAGLTVRSDFEVPSL